MRSIFSLLKATARAVGIRRPSWMRRRAPLQPHVRIAETPLDDRRTKSLQAEYRATAQNQDYDIAWKPRLQLILDVLADGALPLPRALAEIVRRLEKNSKPYPEPAPYVSFNVPVGLLLVPLAVARLRESHGPDTALDLPGLALASAGLLGVVWGLVNGNGDGWTSPGIVASLAAGAAFLVAFVAWELRTAQPMLPMRFFRNRGFSAANAASLAS